MKVLVVEDEVALSLFLKKALELEGHCVHSVTDGRSALRSVEEEQPDLLLLDLGLPQMDGLDVLKALQDSLARMSVIVLTGRSEGASKLECLSLGADEYLMKPFSMQELLVRCRTICRRRSNAGAGILRHDGLLMDRIRRTVAFRGFPVDLTAKEFLLLEYLLEHKSKAASRRELLQSVWQMSPDAGTNVVDVYVNYLRRKLGAVGADGLIETVRGEGYCIVATQRFSVARATPPPLPSPSRLGYAAGYEVA